VAAGPDHGFARERAVLELIERDAVALWWRGGRRGRPIAWDAPAADAAAGLLATLREDQQRRATWLLELTTEIGVPVVAAISVDAARGDQFAVGLSARRTQAAAIEGAVLELCQTELAIQLVAGKAAALGAEGLTDADRVTLRRAAAIDADCPLLHPLGAPALAWARPDSDLPAHLAAHGIVTAFVDLTREDTAVPVVRALAPALQSYPGGRVNVRLGAVIEATGGGDALTGGVTLM
jgi:ribosomal protein S12 methylthiotransferase accessory factor